MIVRYWADALADIDDILSYLHERRPSGARNVLHAIHLGNNEIAEQPRANRQTNDPDIRVKIMTRYRYNIFYSVENDFIDIIHVRHTSRRPWP